MTTEACAQYRAFANDLAGRRIREFELASAAADAERAWRDADLQAQRAAEHVQDVQRRLELVRQERAGASPWSADTIRRHLLAAGAGLLATLWSVIVMVWFGATAISLLSWLILMMRTLEIGAIDRLAARRLSAGEPEPEA